MNRLSSNLTVILKVFIPIAYIVFFGSLFIGSLLININDAPLVGNPIFKLVYGVAFFIFVSLIYFTIFQLKRVDADREYIYINNYLKTYRYSWNDIEKLNTIHYGLFKIIKVHFVDKTSLGKRISFLPSNQLLKEFFIENPELFSKLTES